MLQNGGPPGFLSVADSNVELLEPQALKIEEDINKNYGGSGNKNRIKVFGQKMDWTQMGISAMDMDLLESRKFSLRDICNLYHVSSQLLNDSANKTYNNYLEAKKALIINVVLTELELVVHEFNRKILPPFEKRDGKDYELCTDTSVYPELQADFNQQVVALAGAWWLTPNQKLEIMNLERNENELMNQIWIPAGMTPLDIAAEGNLAASLNYNEPK